MNDDNDNDIEGDDNQPINNPHDSEEAYVVSSHEVGVTLPTWLPEQDYQNNRHALYCRDESMWCQACFDMNVLVDGPANATFWSITYPGINVIWGVTRAATGVGCV